MKRIPLKYLFEAQSDAPNYRKSTSKKKCENCGAFQNGYCEMFDFEAEAEMVCDDWLTEKQWLAELQSED